MTIGPVYTITILIIALTVLISLVSFSDAALKFRLIFYPYKMKRDNEWYRAFTSGFIHNDWIHLFFNMFVLWNFGPLVESYFVLSFGPPGPVLYGLLYLLGIGLSEVYSYFKNQDNPNYMSLGASGAVSAVLFASILFNPWSKIGILFIPYGVPGIIVGILYLVYSQVKARQANDNIGHNAHFYGAVFGFIFPIVIKPHLFIDFIDIIKWNLSH